MTDRSTSFACASGPTRLSPTRTHATWKPRVDDVGVPVRRCARCGRIFVGLGRAAARIETDLWRSTIAHPPYGEDGCPSCSPDELQPIVFRRSCAAEEGFSYAFTGGMDANRLTLSWASTVLDPQLIVLKTFTGLQLRPFPANRTTTFHLADEDAYCYCDLDPCEWCVARCKRGFTVYVVGDGDTGLLFLCEAPPDRSVRDA